MITVIETWHLTTEAAENALAVLQEMDELLDDNAHHHPGWAGHARFFQHASDPQRVTMTYPWESVEQATDLIESETPLLEDFYRRYCVRPREVVFAHELPVDVE
ncbi:hypothetical protein [Rhodococcus sp. BS-15]|uniref:hypothetical protein n=1 Tax=Rhodococcus sp. BS-15 TaxID=1304954 RepID=UPI000ABAF27F|nr:hypothetical protein [Rhodococcus sp. BS-15]